MTHPPEVLTCRKMREHSSLSGLAGRYNGSDNERADVDQAVVENDAISVDSKEAKGNKKAKVEME
jgi:hypothetical protein